MTLMSSDVSVILFFSPFLFCHSRKNIYLCSVGDMTTVTSPRSWSSSVKDSSLAVVFLYTTLYKPPPCSAYCILPVQTTGLAAQGAGNYDIFPSSTNIFPIPTCVCKLFSNGPKMMYALLGFEKPPGRLAMEALLSFY